MEGRGAGLSRCARASSSKILSVDTNGAREGRLAIVDSCGSDAVSETSGTNWKMPLMVRDLQKARKLENVSGGRKPLSSL